MKDRNICELIHEANSINKDANITEILAEIQQKAEKMEDRLLLYCNAIEDLGFIRLDRNYDVQ